MHLATIFLGILRRGDGLARAGFGFFVFLAERAWEKIRIFAIVVIMETNILKAFNNMSKLESFKLADLYFGQNKINNVGAALEYFVRDIFCSSIDVVGLDNKDKKHSEHLSYLGNQNNPPDFIVKNGDAVEVKKIGGLVGSIALNSSYPKSKLRSDDVRILQSCRECDGGNWSKKNINKLITI